MIDVDATVISVSPSLDNLFSAALNHLLAHEGWARAKLIAHAGKVAQFHIGAATLKLQVAADGLLDSAPLDTPAAVTILVRAADLPLIVQHRDRAFSYVKVEGDADFAGTISQVAQSLRWELADDLSRLVGDIAARRIVDGAGAIVATAQSMHRAFTENLAEYFLEEEPMLVRPRAVTALTEDVMRIRDDVERLAKRIERLT